MAELTDLYPTIVNSVGVGVLVYEVEKEGDIVERFRIVFANDLATELLHQDADSLIGKTMMEAFPNLGQTIAPEAFRKAIQDGEPADLGDVTYGDERIPTAIFKVSATPVDGRYIIVSLRNVTELRNLSRALEEKLLGMEKMAMLGNLLAGIAHEIRTPLGAIGSNNEMTRSVLTKVNEELTEGSRLAILVKRIEEASNVSASALSQLTDLVDSLRRMGRKREVEMTAIDIHDVIESTLTLLRHELKYGVTVHKDLGELDKVVGDAGQLTQVFTNLMLNACQAMSGKGNLTVQTRSTATGVVVCIKDDGCGIPPENMDKIFEAGFTTKDAAVGTGLGLTISAESVRAHNGRIDVTSVPGEGATFVVALPSTQSQ